MDTHIVIWLYQGKPEKLSKKAASHIENNQVYISSMVELELQYLYEINKIKVEPQIILDSLYRSIGLESNQDMFTDIVKVARKLTWIRDPFDRLIVAESKWQNAPLVTADTHLLKHYKLGIW